MSEEHRELSQFEGTLASLRPAAGGLDRDRLMWEAGRASRRTHVAWPLAAAAMALAAVALAVWPRQAPVPEPRVVQRIVYVTPEAPPAVPAFATAPAPAWEPTGQGYLALRQAVLARGLDGLPDPPAHAGARTESVADLMREIAG